MSTDGVVRGPGPLTGITVLDFTRVLSGPHCGRMLVDLGADVIKIEPPEGDLTRMTFPRVNSIATYFTQQNCGKRNISLDLRRPEAVELLVKLSARVDVVLENFRPGVMDRLGLGHERLTTDHPRLVYASLTGYGHTGPWMDRRAYASAVTAETGITYLQGETRGNVFANDTFSHGDVYPAIECLAGILAALYQRERTGAGQWMEVSMAETMLCVNEHLHWELQRATVSDAEEVASFRPSDHPILQTGEGHLVVVPGHPAEKGSFERYMRAIGRTDLIGDPRFATVGDRRRHLPELIELVQAWAAGFTDLDLIEAAFARAGLAMGVVRTVAEVADSDWSIERDAIVAVPDRAGGTVRIPNSPWHFSGSESGVRGQPAYRGEHNRSVFSELLGIDGAELDRLEADGIFSSRVPRSAS